jgi:hypothetical protein
VEGVPVTGPDWEKVADDLFTALDSFMAYDGYGQGGSDDANRGDWKGAQSAQDAYASAKEAKAS